MKKEDWKKEIARDFLALGSWVFYILVVGRAFIQPFRPFADRLIIGGILLFLTGIFINKYGGYISRGLVLFVFITMFYNNNTFSIFAIFAFIGLIISSYILTKSKRGIILELVIGGIISLLSYYLSGFTFGG